MNALEMIPETRGIALAGRPESVAEARGWMADRLAEFGAPADAVEAAVLLTSELASNAVLHSRSGAPLGAYILTLRLHPRRLTIEVTDAGAATVPHQRPRPADITDTELACTGRGLTLVAACSTRWWTHTHHEQRITGARIDIPATDDEPQ